MQFVGQSDDGSKLSPNDDIRSLRFSSNRFEPFSNWLAHCLPVIESSMTTRHLPGCQYADFIIVRFELIFGRWMAGWLMANIYAIYGSKNQRIFNEKVGQTVLILNGKVKMKKGGVNENNPK